MNLSLLLPLGLTALAAWLVPLLIHLVRRPEQTPYDFPALRWLRASERPRRRLRLDELVLLSLRLLLLALIALLLAAPLLSGEWREARHWVLTSNTVDLDAAKAEISDASAQWRWLAPGFPEVEDTRPAMEQPVASLLREFEAGLPASDTLTVLVPAETDGLDAERIALGRTIEWTIVPALEPAGEEVVAKKPFKLALRHASDDQPGLRHLRAALAALAEDDSEGLQFDDKPISAPVDADSNAVIWLGAELPDVLKPWIAAGGRAVVMDPPAQSRAGSIILRDESGSALASEQAMGAGAVIHFLQPLIPESLPMLLDAGFPGKLRVLLEGAAPPPTRAIAAEVAPRLMDRAPRATTTPLTGLLGLIIAIVFLIERIVAMRRRHPA